MTKAEGPTLVERIVTGEKVFWHVDDKGRRKAFHAGDKVTVKPTTAATFKDRLVAPSVASAQAAVQEAEANAAKASKKAEDEEKTAPKDPPANKPGGGSSES
jgi:hypothetical protein